MESFNDIINGNQLVLVDFYATWCQPCKMMHPILEQVKHTVGDKLRIIKIDVDKQPEKAAAYKVQSIPTLLLFKQGNVLWRQTGALSRADLLATLDPFLK